MSNAVCNVAKKSWPTHRDTHCHSLVLCLRVVNGSGTIINSQTAWSCRLFVFNLFGRLSKKKESWQAGVDLAAVTQCGKLTLTQTPPAQRILQRLFLAGFYPQSCDCNVKPLTGKHRRTTLSAANECSVYKEQLKLLRAQRTDESPVTNKQRRHGKLRQFKERAGTVIFSDIPASSFTCIVKLVRYSCVLRLIL